MTASIQPTTSQAIQAQSIKKKPKKKAPKAQDVNFMLLVWTSFYQSLKVDQNSAQVGAKQLGTTQKVMVDLNNQLAGYNYQQLPDMTGQSATNQNIIISQTQIANDKIQAEISLTQNNTGVNNQTAQIQETTTNTQVQNSAQVMQQGFSVAQLIASITQMVNS